MKFKRIVVFALFLSLIPMNVHAASTLNESEHDNNAKFEVNISENNVGTRIGTISSISGNIQPLGMPSIAAGKSQVMAITIDALASGKYLGTNSSNKSINPGKSQTYYAICVTQKSGSTASVGFMYLNSSGKMLVESVTTLSGADSYGSISSNSQYKNYGYVKNTGTKNLQASYVIMR